MGAGTPLEWTQSGVDDRKGAFDLSVACADLYGVEIEECPRGVSAAQGITAGPLADWMRLVILNIEGEQHARLRHLVSSGKTTRHAR